MMDNVNTLAYGHHRIPVPHVAVDMHPDGPVDAGMIVLAHQQSHRAKHKIAHQRIMRAALAAPQDAACAGDGPPPKRGRAKKKRAAQTAPQFAACAAPDVDAADMPPPKRISLGTLSERDRIHQQAIADEDNIQIPEAALLNAQTEQLLLYIGGLE